jgi:hypothetical protein
MEEKFIIIGSEGDRAQCPYCFAFFTDNGERYCSDECKQNAAAAKTADRHMRDEEMNDNEMKDYENSSDPL